MAGNITTSSLLKSASSRRAKIQDQQDALVAYEYSLSTKTYQDFLDYSKYLEGRIATTNDPSKVLSYTKNINSARSGYISNEIQRQSIDVIEGKATNTDKYNKMVGLYYQAVDAGNYDLAQSLHLQLNNLSVTIQNQMESAQRVAGTMAMNGVKTLDKLIKLITTDGEGLIALPNGDYVKGLKTLGKETTGKGETEYGYFQEAYDSLKVLNQIITDAYYAAGTQEAADKIASDYGSILDGTKKFKTAAGELTLPEIELAYRSALANNPLYSPAEVRNPTTGELEYKFQKNKIDDFIWVRNDDGTYNAVEATAKILSPYQKLNAKITDDGYFLGETGEEGVGITGEGEKVQSKTANTLRERLEAAGYTVVTDDNGNPVSENGKFTIALPNGEVVQATIQPDGSVRYFGQPGQFSGGQAGMYEIDIFSGQAREVAPDETSIFGTASKFGGLLSKPSDAGVNIIKSLSGVSQSSDKLFSPTSYISNIANDFTGLGSPVVGSNLQGTTQIIRQAEQRQEVLQALATAAQTTQPAQLFNLNQTPVQQFAQNGQPIRQLTVAQPVAAPRVSVAAPQPVKPITSVGVATPGRIGGVSVAGPQGKVTVR